MAIGIAGVISLLWPYATSADARSRGEKPFNQCAAVLAVILIPTMVYWSFF